jgi:hypothetical protein
MRRPSAAPGGSAAIMARASTERGGISR